MSSAIKETLELQDLDIQGYERVVRATDPSVGLDAIIAIHSLALGPALGGTRIYPYNNFEDALTDALRLAQGMTYKAAITEVGIGGGKSVIILDEKRGKTPELLRRFGEAVELLQGTYIAAEDVGCSPADIAHVAETTPFVVGLVNERSSGNPSPFTAWGTMRGMQAVAKKINGNDDLKGMTVLIQGLGSVGTHLAELLHAAGAKLILTDINLEKARDLASRLGCRICSPTHIAEVECDIYAPCALGGTLNPMTISRLQCRAVAGCANNQLLSDSDADRLHARGILYAPDFVINSGGLLNVVGEVVKEGYDSERVLKEINKIYDQLLAIFAIAEQKNISTQGAALHLCDYRIKYGIGKREKPLYFHHSDYRLDV